MDGGIGLLRMVKVMKEEHNMKINKQYPNILVSSMNEENNTKIKIDTFQCPVGKLGQHTACTLTTWIPTPMTVFIPLITLTYVLNY